MASSRRTTLEKRIMRELGIREIPNEARTISLDLSAKADFELERYSDALRKKAEAALGFLEIHRYYHAGMAFDRASTVASRLRRHKVRAFIAELGGASYEEIEKWENAAFSYLRAAESYKRSGIDTDYAIELLRKSEGLFSRVGIEPESKSLYRIIRKTVFSTNNANEAPETN